jgi:hypothetical protein
VSAASVLSILSRHEGRRQRRWTCGGLGHGHVIGSTEKDGGQIKERPVTPGDLAATIFAHMGVPLDATWNEPTGRPRYVVEHGKPIGELS